MKFKAEIDVMPNDNLLDPQGKAVLLGLSNLGFSGAENVRVGKHITLTLEASNEEEAREITKLACEKLLANAIMESFRFELTAC